MDTSCAICKKDANTLSKHSERAGMFCIDCQKFYCASHSKVTQFILGKCVTVKTCNKGHDHPKREECATCTAIIWVMGGTPYYGEGIYCRECGRYYCNAHCKTTEWKRIVAGVDAANRHVTCDKGHTLMQTES